MAQDCLCVGTTILSTSSPAVFSLTGLVGPVFSGGSYHYTAWYKRGNYWKPGATGSSSSTSDYSSTYNVYAGYYVASSLSGGENLLVESKQCFTITVQYGTGGTASGGGRVVSGGSISISATPTNGGTSAPSYVFTQWQDGSGSASRTLTNVSADATYTASFAQSTWKISAATESSTKGTVSSAINQYCTPGTTVSCTATPKLGYTFIGWFRAGQSLPDYTTATANLLVYSADTVYTAKFYDSNNTLTVTAGTGGSVDIKKADGTSVTSGSDVEEGVSLTVTATPEYNYAFSQWTGSGVSSSTSQSYMFTMPATPVTLTAYFTQKAPLTLTLSAENGDMGSYTLKRDDTDIDINIPLAGTAVAPASISGTSITVTYSGAADAGSSGLKHVELWASKDGGAWYDTELTDTGAEGAFSYLPDSAGRYAFRLVAEDNAGNRSAAASGSGDCSTVLSSSGSGGDNILTNSVVESYSSVYKDKVVSNCIDGDTSSYWRADGNGTRWAVFKLDALASDYVISSCSFYGDYNYGPKDFKLYASPSASGDSDWTQVASGKVGQTSMFYDFPFTPVTAKRVKLEITSGYYSSYRVYEFKVAGVLSTPSALECSVGAPDPATTYGDDVSFSIKFTSSVTGFTVDDITLSKTGTADGTLVGFAGEGDAYSVNVTGISGTGTIGISVAAEVCQDEDGVLNEASNSATYVVSDSTPPIPSVDITVFVGVEYTLTAAVTDSGFNEFLGWYSGADALLKDDLSYKFTPATDEDIAVVAKFAEKPSYVVTKWSSDGTVPYVADNEAATDGCDFTIHTTDYKPPDKWLAGNLLCTAVPATGWQLAQWTVARGIPPASLTPMHQNPPLGVGTPSNPYVFDLAFDAVVHAIFTKIPYTVTVTADPAAVYARAVRTCFVHNGDEADFNEVTVLYGNKAVVTAAAETGFSFAGWYLEDGTLVTATAIYSPTITGNLALVAKFKATVSLTSAHSVNADEEGTVQIDGGTAGATATKDVIIGETCTITAIGVEPVGESEGAIFNSWHLSTDTLFEEPIAGYLQEQEITVDGNLTMNAYFVGYTDIETRYLALRNYNNNTFALEPLIGILESSGGEEIEELDYLTFIYGSVHQVPTMLGEGDEPGPRYFKFTGTQSTTLGASSVTGLGFMRWDRVHLSSVAVVDKGGASIATINAIAAADLTKWWFYTTSDAGDITLGPDSGVLSVGSGVDVIWMGDYWTLKDSVDIPLWEESTPAVIVGTSPTPTILTSRHFVLTAVWGDPQPILLTIKYASGSDSSMGAFNADPETEAKQTVQGGFSDVYLQDSEVLLTANVLNGYKFSGWYYDSAGTLLVSADTTYTHKVGSPVTIYAKFIQDTDAIYKWEGDTAKKMLRWRSKRYVAVRPFNPSAARVYADAYPATLNLYMASSPNAPVTATVEVQVKRQDGLRLPIARPEKYMEVEVTATCDVTEIAVGTSMGGLVG